MSDKKLVDFTKDEKNIMAEYWEKFQDYAMANEEFRDELGYSGKTYFKSWQRKVPNENFANDNPLIEAMKTKIKLRLK